MTNTVSLAADREILYAYVIFAREFFLLRVRVFLDPFHCMRHVIFGRLFGGSRKAILDAAWGHAAYPHKRLYKFQKLIGFRLLTHCCAVYNKLFFIKVVKFSFYSSKKKRKFSSISGAVGGGHLPPIAPPLDPPVGRLRYLRPHFYLPRVPMHLNSFPNAVTDPRLLRKFWLSRNE